MINNVHYEFRNGIGEESFGREVLERFVEYKEDDLNESEQNVKFKEGDNAMNIWTIEDAKPGDVVVCDECSKRPWIGLVKLYDGEDNLHVYCYLEAGHRRMHFDSRNHTTDNLYLATKDQRNLLFQKMKEFGYEWNAEKLELKKIERCGDCCGDNRFEIIDKAKQNMLNSTNIETSPDEMKVLDSFLFRCWQMRWLEKYNEPKFKAGDWVVSPNGVYWHIDAVNSRYEVSTITGEYADWPLNTNIYHLWTIKDAKSGDVLLASDNSVFIYKKEINSSINANFYVACTQDGKIAEGGDNECGWEEINSCYPANEEQRRFLFQTLKKEGYEWNAESLKLIKVEQKFNVGDWIINSSGKINQIVSVGSDGDGFTLDDDTYFSGSWAELYCLWNIKDAKPGDIIVNGSNIFIFSYLSETRAMGYCHVNTDDMVFYDDNGKNDCFGLIDSVFTPADREQRELLFRKMKSAGYEFDFEKLELKHKFKVGDWIVSKSFGDVAQIKEYTEDGTVRFVDKSGPVEVLDNYRLWTFKDAKPGDVLSYRDGQWIFIFKSMLDETTIKYFVLLSEYGLTFDDVAYTLLPYSIVPATREQQELLFSKLNEVGYWDPVKLEFKSEITDEDIVQAKKDAFNDALDKIEYHSDEPSFDDGWSAAIDFMKKNLQRKTAEQKWTEEDEQIFNKIMSFIPHHLTDESYSTYANWLKKIHARLEKKSEARFKVGDWVTLNNHVITRITDVREDGYCNSDNGVIPFRYEYEMHLWTIKDAMNGDVLSNGSDILIFKRNNYNPETNEGCMCAYCIVGEDYIYFNDIGEINPTGYLPATKEQRDMLFNLMKDAGYEWNANLLELKKK